VKQVDVDSQEKVSMGPGEILIINGFFIPLWIGTALLFRRAIAMGLKCSRRLD